MSDAKSFVSDLQEVEAERHDWGGIKWLCNRELIPGAEQTFGIVYILPGQRNPLHYHPNCEEVLLVLSGEGDHRLGDEWVHLTPGMMICIPTGEKHQLANNGWEPVRCAISFSSPDRQTVMVEETAATEGS